MKKYRLFEEHMNIEIYGGDLVDALERLPALPFKPEFMDGGYVQVPPVSITKVLGWEDVSFTRGDNIVFERIIVLLGSGKIIAVDGHPCSVTITTF